MSTAVPTLHLLLPGLRGPLPLEVKESGFWQQRLPALEKLFARARIERHAAQHLSAQLRELFQIPDTELPAGALGWLGEGREPGKAYWLRADPVHLVADRDQLLLFDATALALAAEEAAELVAACNQLLQEDGLKLHAAAPGRWYLQASEPIDLQTTPVAAVAGRYLQDFLPRGAHASRWLSLGTELQMLLHQAPQNSRREALGQPAVNSLWFWGAGALPAHVAGGWQQVFSDDPVVRGLAQVSGAAVLPMLEEASQLGSAERCLVVETRLIQALRSGDLERWRAELYGLEQRLFVPLLQRLQRREIAAVRIDLDGLRLTVDKRELSKFWRRPQPLRHYLEF